MNGQPEGAGGWPWHLTRKVAEISIECRLDTRPPACSKPLRLASISKPLLSSSCYPIISMSSSLQESSSPPHFQQPIFEKALKEYRKKTGKDLTAHPLAAQINGCNSPEAILTVLEPIANELNQSQSSDQRHTKWLNPTVNILSALSATLGQGAGLVSYSAGLITCPFPNVTFHCRYSPLPPSSFLELVFFSW